MQRLAHRAFTLSACLTLLLGGYLLTLGARPAHATPACCFGQRIYWVACGQGSVCGLVEVYGCEQGLTGYVPQEEYIYCPNYCLTSPFVTTPPTQVGCAAAAPTRAELGRRRGTSIVAYYVASPSGGFRIARGRE